MSKALCVGINDYPGTENDLAGCVNDAKDWHAALTARGFDAELMLDGDASKKSMVDAISELVAATPAGGLGVLTYSGHGTWMPDEDGDEPDHRDEALCPYDITDGNVLSDDELFDIFSERERGARIVFISDSCHSGTVARLAPVSSDVDNNGRVRFLAPEVFLSPEGRARAVRVQTARPAGRPRHPVLLMAGCRDTEYSYDASFGGRPNGAFTYYAIKALDGLKEKADYLDWFKAIRKNLPSAAHPQTPNLFGSSRQKHWDALR
jgi:hypothetical protein